MGGGASATEYRVSANEMLELADSIKDEPELMADLKDKFDSAYALLAKTSDGIKQSTGNLTDPMSELVSALGGDSKIRELKTKSKKIIASVDNAVPDDPRFLEQHLIYEGAGLGKLISDGHAVKTIFDKFCKKVCDTWSEKFSLKCHYIGAPVKGMSRAEVKVRVELNGKTTQLKDVVRGTISLDCEPGEQSLALVYDALEDLVENAEHLKSGISVQVVRLKDRYQAPAGSYRDIMMNIKLRNFICELQVNFAAALEQKETKEHAKYEFDRLAKANLLDAAMRGDATGVKVMLATGVRLGGLQDSNHCTPLAYACVHGSYEMATALLQHGADTLVIDKAGCLPVQYALSQGASDVAAAVFDHMLTLDMNDYPLNLPTALCATWSMVIKDSALKFLEEKAFSIFNKFCTGLHAKLACAASLGDYPACKHLFDLGKTNAHSGSVFHPSFATNLRALDWAVLSGASSKLVDLLLKHGGCLTGTSLHNNPQKRALEYAATDKHANLRVLFQLQEKKIQRHFPSADWGSPEWPGTPLSQDEIMVVAAERQSKRVLRGLIQSGYSLSERVEALEGQLFVAACSGDVEFCEVLLDLGVDINAANVKGHTPLCVASQTGELEACELFIKRKADPNIAKKPRLVSPAHMAVMYDREHVLRVLLQAKADVNAKDCDEDTPLSMAKKSRAKAKLADMIEQFVGQQ